MRGLGTSATGSASSARLLRFDDRLLVARVSDLLAARGRRAFLAERRTIAGADAVHGRKQACEGARIGVVAGIASAGRLCAGR